MVRPTVTPSFHTVEAFLAAFAVSDARFELIDGVPQPAPSATRRRVEIVSNILSCLEVQLRGSGYTARLAEYGIMIGEATYRLPDIAIYIDTGISPWFLSGALRERQPRVVIDVKALGFDYGGRLADYRRLSAIETIVFVDPVHATFVTHERVDADRWRTIGHTPDEALVLNCPAVELAAAELFASSLAARTGYRRQSRERGFRQ